MGECVTGKKPRLRITTPSIRPENLPVIERDQEMLRATEFFDASWHILFDCYSMKKPVEGVYHTPLLPWERVENIYLDRPGPRHGEDLYNDLVTKMDPDEWWMGLADDSLPVPGIFEALRREVDAGADVVMFPLRIPGIAYCLATPDSIRPSHVSGGQVFYRAGVIGDLRWKSQDDLLDGVFLRELYARTKDTAKWRFAIAPLIVHNQLRQYACPGGLKKP